MVSLIGTSGPVPSQVPLEDAHIHWGSDARTHSSRGFTLLELLISLVMIGSIALIITGAVRLGLRSTGAGEKKIDHIARTRASFHIIDAQLQSQIPLSYEEQAEKKHYFQGDKGTLQFATNYSVWGGQKGYVLARYRAERNEQGRQQLSLSENIIGTNSIRETLLFTEVDEISFDYYFIDPVEGKEFWVDAWTDETKIPPKVRLHLRYGERDISMIIPLRTMGVSSQQSQSQTEEKKSQRKEKRK